MNGTGKARTLSPPPRWLEQERLPRDLLERLLTRLEKGQRLNLRINPKTAPQLYDFQQEDVAYLWELVRSLDKDYHVLTIELEPRQSGKEDYENARLRFNPDKEDLVRHWLGRPALDPYALVWQHQLDKIGGQFEDGGALLSQRIVRVPEQGAERTLRAFACIGRELHRPLTLRTLSARCFWGDSKFLEPHEDLVRELYPSLEHHLQARPILLAVSLPERLEQVLFVENQDTFLALNQYGLPGHALVFGAGFRGSAGRIRAAGNAVFSYLPGDGRERARDQFERWWFSPQQSPISQIPAWFWGDLDFAGMAILRALRQTFLELQAWKPGYQALLERLQQGLGHAHHESGKERQKDPLETGCSYADKVLLPALREVGRFIDQEAIEAAPSWC